jgi:NADPH-dependent 2,4-dienoyl-CoA reductase/sulfur reductase-like enzyme
LPVLDNPKQGTACSGRGRRDLSVWKWRRTLHHLGLQVTLVEMLDQIMPPMDHEMVRPLETHLRERGIELVPGEGVEGFEAGEESKLREGLQSLIVGCDAEHFKA